MGGQNKVHICSYGKRLARLTHVSCIHNCKPTFGYSCIGVLLEKEEEKVGFLF